MAYTNHRVREKQLTNGSALICVESPHLPYSVVSAGFRAGSRFDPPQKTGLSHLAEHLFMARTPRFRNREERLAKLESAGISFDAVTHHETVMFYQSQLERSLPQSLELLWDGLTNTTVTSAAVEREKRVIADEYHRDQNDTAQRIWRCGARALWPDARLDLPATGTQATLRNITLADVRRWHSAVLHPGRAVYVVVGNKRETELAETFFMKKTVAIKTEKRPVAKLNASGTSGKTIPVSFCKATQRRNEHVPVGIFFKTASVANEADRIALAFIRHYLAGSWIALLIRELREKRSYTYWVDANSEYFSDAGYLEFQFSASRKNVLPAVSAAVRACRALKEKQLLWREIEPHKTSLIAEVAKTSQDPEHLLSWYSHEPLLGASALDYQTFISEIEALDGKRIQQTAQAYLSRERAALVVGAPESAPLKTKVARALATL